MAVNNVSWWQLQAFDLYRKIMLATFSTDYMKLLKQRSLAQYHVSAGLESMQTSQSITTFFVQLDK
jgi:hypothetical protein